MKVTSPQDRTPGRHASLTMDGVRSPVREFGAPDASEAVVFVHGLPGSLHDWDVLKPEVGRFARAIAFDLPGYGAADKLPTFGYAVPDFADHMEGLLDQLGVRRAHLMLHDLGGA